LRSQKKRQITEVIETKSSGLTKPFISKTLGIPERNLYNKASKLKEKDEILKDQILKVLELNPSYGHRRIALALKINKKRVRRVMKLYHILPYKRKARWAKKRDYGKPPAPYPNLIKGSCSIKPNVFWAGDFTRLIWNSKIVYLATYMDLFTREIVGWSISTKHTTEFVMDAFLDAVKSFGTPRITHTDQGSEYQSKDYIKFIQSMGVKVSMSKKASPWENAYQESFYDNFKTDLGLEFERFLSVGEFVEAINQTIWYYNNQRIHTKLKMPPIKFKQRSQSLFV
jgi:transposase InsO family protein